MRKVLNEFPVEMRLLYRQAKEPSYDKGAPKAAEHWQVLDMMVEKVSGNTAQEGAPPRIGSWRIWMRCMRHLWSMRERERFHVKGYMELKSLQEEGEHYDT